MKVLIINSCDKCCHFERNMYHGSCCWHEKVSQRHPEGRIPKIIEHRRSDSKIYIPSWCPLDDYKE